ncbi:MAG: pyruvate, phosphate dikinase [Planctomycetes bacterium]|nr:pyruvate, phosphate dikinase [Planctomycetota bacterium]
MAKHVYFFGGGKAEGRGDQKDLLGGKGAGLAEMSRAGLPVPAGFTITVDSCDEYYKNGKKISPALRKEVEAHLKRLEKLTGKRLGDPQDPLLVSVRSGAANSMPGMMETILNLGLNDESVEGLAAKTNNPRFAYDGYRRFIQMYSTTAMGLSKEPMEEMLHALKHKLGVKTDPEIPAPELKKLCADFKEFYKRNQGSPFPQNPIEQMWGAIEAVWRSWTADKAVTYRKVEKLTGLKGTGVNVMQMVFGNKGDTSGTGVCFTRDPNTGVDEFYGDYLSNAQGEDVVAGIRTPVKLTEMEKVNKPAYVQLCEIRKRLEKHYKDMQDLEFTVEEGKLYMLQTRRGKRTPAATFRIAVELVKEKLITKEEAVSRITPEDIERLFYPQIDPSLKKEQLAAAKIAEGINAVPGAAGGKVIFEAGRAEAAAKAGDPVLLVRKETSPEDVGGMAVAKGILTATGGKTSHAAVVARGWGKCCIVGCEELNIDYGKRQMSVDGKVVKEGDFLTLDGNTGSVYTGRLPLKDPTLPKEYHELMSWADQIRTIKVRTNADTPADSKKAIEMGAEGIGLCRTEHMFFETEARRLAIQEMIVANDEGQRRKALEKLLPFQRDDFAGIFKAMDGKPVTIRLIDPPLHEFTPKDDEGVNRLSKATGMDEATIRHRVEQLHEANPMLGHRGCRLCITYPEILEMQVRAIIEAACACQKQKVKALPEIMIPLTMDRKELAILVERVHAVAAQAQASSGEKVKYMVGTMIEIPRAALTADRIAEVAEFFSFGTNDLTQMTMGLSRDDAGRFLPDYVDEKKAAVFKVDPFQALDVEGVGQLVEMGIERGRSTRPGLKVGICGEHGGEQNSVKFCVRAGMDYVSCSPYRVPIARLAAAQAAIEDGKKGGGVRTGKATARKSATARSGRSATRRAAPATRKKKPAKKAKKIGKKKR